DFRIGARSTNKINQVIQSVIFRYTKSIFTDGYCIYKNVIPSSLYKLKRYGTNIIERMNLNLRTHLKRLCRRTISFTRKRDMLEASLKIYFWG
ncbi:MAG: IS1 family transposase, partial [Bacteroidetes bacterium]|nr:IS1 family transposase [Bacteroidota bacterium]